MIGRAHHLHDDGLFQAYQAELDGTAVEPSSAAHLTACDACAKRLRELEAFMDTLREEGEAELDAVFTPERLRLQQRQIADRLEHLGQAGRVLSFPARLMGGRMLRTASRIAPRWAVAAAAAGLLVGLGAGTMIDWARHYFSPSAAMTTGALQDQSFSDPFIDHDDVIGAGDVVAANDAIAADDDMFLTELEMALTGPRNEELQPFDALTPRVQPINNQFP